MPVAGVGGAVKAAFNDALDVANAASDTAVAMPLSIDFIALGFKLSGRS